MVWISMRKIKIALRLTCSLLIGISEHEGRWGTNTKNTIMFSLCPLCPTASRDWVSLAKVVASLEILKHNSMLDFERDELKNARLGLSLGARFPHALKDCQAIESDTLARASSSSFRTSCLGIKA